MNKRNTNVLEKLVGVSIYGMVIILTFAGILMVYNRNGFSGALPEMVAIGLSGVTLFLFIRDRASRTNVHAVALTFWEKRALLLAQGSVFAASLIGVVVLFVRFSTTSRQAGVLLVLVIGLNFLIDHLILKATHWMKRRKKLRGI